MTRTWLGLFGLLLIWLGVSGCKHSPGGGTGGVGVPPDMAMSTASCDSPALAAGCVVGHCRLVLAPGALAAGAKVTLMEKPLPSSLASDAVGDVLCGVQIPAGALTGELTLAIHVDSPADPTAALFQLASVGASSLVAGSSSASDEVSGLIADSGDYGVTLRPGPWSVAAVSGVDVSSAGDQASLLRNLSSNLFTGAYYDGSRLYVANGVRVLVWNGLPASPAVPPALVLGQPSLVAGASSLSASGFAGGVAGIWSDGTRLVVATGNRVLIWNSPPQVSFQPADLELGQPDFSSDASDQGGVSAESLAFPQEVDSDGTRLMVADTLNHRVLVWNSFPLTLGQPASSVIGQPSFTSNVIGGGATPLYQSWGALIASPTSAFVSGLFGAGLMHVPAWMTNNPPTDFKPIAFGTVVEQNTAYEIAGLAHAPAGGLAARDVWGQRVLVWHTMPTGPEPVDVCLGQPDCWRTVVGQPSASAFGASSMALGGGGGQLLVPDGNRLLVFEGEPAYHFQPASRVIGQAGFSTDETVDYRGISATTLAAPAGVAVQGGTVAVADRGNNRVLLYRASDLGNGGASAQLVVGQPDMVSYLPNVNQRTPSAATMSGPGGVALDGTHLIVADTENHRVLIWSTLPTVNGQPADIILGQSDGSGNRPNRGRGDSNPADGFSDADADGFFEPTGVASDGTHLFVSDRVNHRVLGWSTFPTGNAQPADLVLGQPSMTANQPNRGQGPYAPAPDGFDLPTGLQLYGATLWVADTESNRVVRWDNVTTLPTPGAFVGQPDGMTLGNPNSAPPSSGIAGSIVAQPTTSSSVLRPRAVAVAGGRLYVAETDSNRVHFFDAASLAPLGELGQASDTTANANVGGVSAIGLWGPLGLASDGARLYAADARNHRVIGWDLASPPSNDAPASVVLGQPSFLLGGFDQASSAAGGVTKRPSGLARSGNLLYVADTDHNRVLAFTAPPQPGAIPARVFGQPDGSLSLPNSGVAPSARTLDGPRGVYADAQRLIVADTGNHRVLVYAAGATTSDATLVLGQPGFDGNQPNQGGAAGLQTLQAPEGVYSDGTQLWIADTGNHRVLGWTTFPTSNGQPADLVIGQASGVEVQPNRGGAADATTLASPGAVALADGAFLIADTGNNRVLAFAAPPTTTGAAATAVLGQPDFAGRTPAADVTDLTRLAGPVALASDGVWLYVADRDLGRIAAFALPVMQSGAAAVTTYGSLQGDHGLTLQGPQGLAVDVTPYFTTRLYIADSGQDRIVTLSPLSRLLPVSQ